MALEPKEVVSSRNYETHLTEILYTYYPPCRHIPTKSRKYRNIILDAHLIIYRITAARIEVLDIVHGAMSVSRIRSVRSVKI